MDTNCKFREFAKPSSVFIIHYSHNLLKAIIITYYSILWGKDTD